MLAEDVLQDITIEKKLPAMVKNGENQEDHHYGAGESTQEADGSLLPPFLVLTS